MNLSNFLKTKFPIGIHKQVEFSPEWGENFLDLNYTKGIMKDNLRLYFPDQNKVYPYDKETKEEAYLRAKKEFIEAIAYHLYIVMDEAEFMSLKTLEKYAAVAEVDIPKFITDVKKLFAKYPTGTANIKVTYDSQGQFTQIPRRKSYEKWMGPDVDTTLQFTDWEVKNRLTYKGSQPKAETTPQASSDLASDLDALMGV